MEEQQRITGVTLLDLLSLPGEAVSFKYWQIVASFLIMFFIYTLINKQPNSLLYFEFQSYIAAYSSGLIMDSYFRSVVSVNKSKTFQTNSSGTTLHHTFEKLMTQNTLFASFLKQISSRLPFTLTTHHFPSSKIQIFPNFYIFTVIR